MAKFVKINRNPENPEYTGTEWRLLIDNAEDLLKYSDLDTYLNLEAYLTVNPKTHPKGRNAHVLSLIEIGKINLKEGVKMYPLAEIAKVMDRKAIFMLQCIQNGETLCINSAGGYCFLDGYLDTWNGTIIETIEKEDFGFPVDGEITKAKYLVLENNPKGITSTVYDYVHDNKITEYTVINSLREKDATYVFKAIEQAENILIHSEFTNTAQVDQFLKGFSILDRKNIFIGTYSKDNLNNLIQSPLYQTCLERHNVTFLN